MPLERLSADVALQADRDNEFNRWPKRDGGPNRVEPICKPAFHPGFKLGSGDKVFTIGSCFARNVERELARRGFDLPAWRIVKADEEFERVGTNVLNNYAAPSIYNEISWALDPERPFVPEDNLYEVFPGKFVDLHVARVIRPGPLDYVKKRRESITRVYKEIAECPLTVMTLGLTETWYDTSTSLYLNTRPHNSMMLKHPNRFELHVLDYADTIGFLTKTFDLLKKNCRPDVRVLLTVSPVPLTTTYRNMDVITANTYSKSVLRAAAEEIVSRYDFVEYYPSYESVTLTRRDLAWVDDQTHVQKDLIDVNVGRMVAAYTDFADTDQAAGELSLQAQATISGIRERTIVDAPTIFGFLDSKPDLVRTDPQLAAAYGLAALAVGKVEAAETALSHIPADWEPVQRDLFRAELLMARQDYREASGVARRLLQTDQPRFIRNKLWVMLIKATLEAESANAGAMVLEEWKGTAKRIRKAEPFRLIAMALDQSGDPKRADAIFREGLNCPRANTHILADYIEFLDKHGRRDEAMKLLPNLDEQSPNLMQRKRELSLRLGVSVASMSEAQAQSVSSDSDADADEDPSGERRRVRLMRRGKEIWATKDDAASPPQRLTREQREERRRARREGNSKTAA